MPRLHFPLILLTFTLLLLETPVFVSASPIPYTYTSSSLTGSEVEASGSQRAWTPEQIKEVEMMRIAGAAEPEIMAHFGPASPFPSSSPSLAVAQAADRAPSILSRVLVSRLNLINLFKRGKAADPIAPTPFSPKMIGTEGAEGYPVGHF